MDEPKHKGRQAHGLKKLSERRVPVAEASIDFETYSTCDLRAVGVYKYAEDPTTNLWCMAWAIGDDEPEIWIPGQPLPAPLHMHIAMGGALRAWNAQFERVIWNTICTKRYGFPEAELDQWYDTAADAAAMSLPRALGHCAEVLKVEHQKDKQGHALMMRMCRPRSKEKDGRLVWWNARDNPDKHDQLYSYCKDDVRTERAVGKVLRPLGADEREVYLLDQRINDRGVYLDLPLARASQKIVRQGLEQINGVIAAATGGDVTAVTQHARLAEWLKGEGVDTDSVAKDVVTGLLAGELPDHARLVLEARAEGARSSTAKLSKLFEVACADSRGRGLLFYHGASTGRWSGRLLQPHNFPRGEVDNVEEYVDWVLAGEFELIDMLAPPLAVVSSLLRGHIRAPDGHQLYVGDFGQIEARVTAWLAGQTDMLHLFANKGKVYEMAAARIYNVPVASVTKGSDMRQMGKAQILGCGFGMGGETFKRQAKKQYQIEMTQETADEVVADYRDNNKKIVELWRSYNEAAVHACQNPGTLVSTNKCRFIQRGGYLWIILPSGRPLCYAAPFFKMTETPWGELKDTLYHWHVNSQSRKWESRHTYGGLWTENIVQAIARDIMMEAMLRTEKKGYVNVLSVHDEVVSEVGEDFGSVEEYTQLMEQVPVWAEGCPVEVDAFTALRYKK